MRQIQRQKDTLTKDIAFGGAIIKVKHYIHKQSKNMDA